jgi:hypothetical protein
MRLPKECVAAKPNSSYSIARRITVPTSVPVTISGQQVLVPNHVVAVPPEVTVPDGIQTNARVNNDKPGMAVSGRACLRPPPGFSENPCLSYATCMDRQQVGTEQQQVGT